MQGCRVACRGAARPQAPSPPTWGAPNLARAGPGRGSRARVSWGTDPASPLVPIPQRRWPAKWGAGAGLGGPRPPHQPARSLHTAPAHLMGAPHRGSRRPFSCPAAPGACKPGRQPVRSSLVAQLAPRPGCGSAGRLKAKARPPRPPTEKRAPPRPASLPRQASPSGCQAMGRPGAEAPLPSQGSGAFRVKATKGKHLPYFLHHKAHSSRPPN